MAVVWCGGLGFEQGGEGGVQVRQLCGQAGCVAQELCEEAGVVVGADGGAGGAALRIVGEGGVQGICSFGQGAQGGGGEGEAVACQRAGDAGERGVQVGAQEVVEAVL